MKGFPPGEEVLWTPEQYRRYLAKQKEQKVSKAQFGARGSHGQATIELLLDFVNGLYRRNGVLYPDFATLLSATDSTFTRASAGWDLGVSTSFLSNVARITSAGLTYEPAGTNLLTYSSKFDQSSDWPNVQGLAFLTSNSVAAPDGSNTATAMGESATTDTHQIYRFNVTVATGAITVTIYIKAAGRTWIDIATDAGSSYFNLSGAGSLGTIAGGTTATIQAIAGGYYKIVLKYTITARANAGIVIHLANANGATSYAGDGTSGVRVWEAQMEQAATGSSPIHTTSASVTRAADALTLAVPSGLATMTATFDDDSTQVVGSASGNYLVPTNLNRSVIKSLAWA